MMETESPDAGQRGASYLAGNRVESDRVRSAARPCDCGFVRRKEVEEL
jgi:hypothetical protein